MTARKITASTGAQISIFKPDASFGTADISVELATKKVLSLLVVAAGSCKGSDVVIEFNVAVDVVLASSFALNEIIILSAGRTSKTSKQSAVKTSKMSSFQNLFCMVAIYLKFFLIPEFFTVPLPSKIFEIGRFSSMSVPFEFFSFEFNSV